MRAVCEPRVGPSELQSRIFHLYLYISDGVRHDVIQWLTSRRIFVSRQHSTENDFEFPPMTKALMKSCLFIVCKTVFTIGESQAFLMQTEQQTQERRIVNPRRGRFDTEKSSGAKNADLKFNGASSKDGWRRQQQTAEQRTSLNEFQMLKFFKSKWKQFWIISLINI